MGEFPKLVEALSRLETLLAFLALIVPGVLSLRTYDVLRGGEPRKVADSLIDIVIYSFASDALVATLLLANFTFVPPALRLGGMIVAIVVGLVIMPIALAYGFYELRQNFASARIFTSPISKPWDQFFVQVRRSKLDLGVMCTLADGRVVGGRFAPGTVSHDPADEQILIGEVWLIDQTTHQFTMRIVGTRGMLIDKKDVVLIEFVEWNAADPIPLLPRLDT